MFTRPRLLKADEEKCLKLAARGKWESFFEDVYFSSRGRASYATILSVKHRDKGGDERGRNKGVL